MTVKGQITVPKDIREVLGMGPGDIAEFVRNEAGEIVLRHKQETPAQKQARIMAAIASVRGTASTGMTTDDYMREIRGDWEP